MSKVSNEVAIDILQAWRDAVTNSDSHNSYDILVSDACETAIKALKTLSDAKTGHIKKWRSEGIVVYNHDWLMEHIDTETEVLKGAAGLRRQLDDKE